MNKYAELAKYLNSAKPEREMIFAQMSKQPNKSYYTVNNNFNPPLIQNFRGGGKTRVNARVFLKSIGVPDEQIEELFKEAGFEEAE